MTEHQTVKRYEYEAINITPLGNLKRPGETIVIIFQDGRNLEECDDITLMEGFR